jgi:hypothetical protein
VGAARRRSAGRADCAVRRWKLLARRLGGGTRGPSSRPPNPPPPSLFSVFPAAAGAPAVRSPSLPVKIRPHAR